ncbi:predicted integral membrane protein [Malacoplasma penetrans HF-2]|uniref:Predicted integral membrane protein n=1 Tax=Malacoplasma penetrans (strain HF-2) TaxID=272633 RepID=Q8EVF9_MALP2|nr:hypothetical protein [Malacoplasma penetrans]BAC44395.1 predicted integral membrane protein [Malacoplasma penetrans HF-2]
MKISSLKWIGLSSFSLAIITLTPQLFLTAVKNENFNYDKSTLNSNSLKNTKATNSTEKWIEEIKKPVNNTNIQLVFTRDVTLVYQQSLIFTNYWIEEDNFKNATTSDSNTEPRIVWLANQTDVNNKKWNFDFYNLSPASSKVKLITNTNFNNGPDLKYSNWIDDQMLDELVSYYTTKISSSVKFDLWVSDINIEDLWKGDNSVSFYNFLKYVNKINIISDGNYQTIFFAQYFQDRTNESNYKQLTSTEASNLIKQYQTDTNNSLYSKFQNTKIYDFLLASDFITMFNVESYSNSPYYLLGNNSVFYDVYPIDYDYYNMGKTFFGSDATKFNSFINRYQSFFNFSSIHSITDFFERNAISYSSSKKNIIWIGDSLITDPSEMYSQRQEELQALTTAMLKKYKPSEYNWIIKHHPRYSVSDQEALIDYIFPNNFNPITFKSFPWEVFLSWDNYQQQTNQNYIPFFDKDLVSSFYLRTSLVGLQYSSTVIETTYFYLTNTHKWNQSLAYETVNASNFPVPATFNVVRPTQSYDYLPLQTLSNNLKRIEESHEPFYQLNVFPNYKQDIISIKDFANNLGVSYKYPIKEDNTIKIILGVLVPSVIIILIAITTSIVLVRKRKQKNKKSNINKIEEITSN